MLGVEQLLCSPHIVQQERSNMMHIQDFDVRRTHVQELQRQAFRDSRCHFYQVGNSRPRRRLRLPAVGEWISLFTTALSLARQAP